MQTCWISQCSISKAFKMRWRWVRHLHHDQIEMMAKSQWQMVVLLIAGLPLIFTWYCLSISYRNSTKKWKIVPVDAKTQPHDCLNMGAWSDGQFFALCLKNHHFMARQPKVRSSVRAPWCSAEMGWTLTRHKCEKSFWFEEFEGRDSGRLKFSYQISVNNCNVRESNPKLYIVKWYCWLVVNQKWCM